MKNLTIEERFRQFLLSMTAVIFAGTVFELVLVDHFDKILQWIPFILCGAGLLAVGYVWFSPDRISLSILRWVMVITAVGSLLGIYLHFNGNLDFVQEVHPEYSWKKSMWQALKGGNPLMAPGILYLAGMMGLAVTYKHPELK